jgi:hypothetical protein
MHLGSPIDIGVTLFLPAFGTPGATGCESSVERCCTLAFLVLHFQAQAFASPITDGPKKPAKGGSDC